MMAWRDRYLEDGPAEIGTVRAGRGRKRQICDEVVEAIVNDTLTAVPDDGSACWTIRSAAQRPAAVSQQGLLGFSGASERKRR